MNDANKVQYIIEILTRIEKRGEAANELKSVDDAAKKAQQSLSNLKTIVGAVVTAFGGYVAVRAMVREVEEADRANTRLTLALKNQVGEMRVTRAEADGLADTLQKVTTAQDDVTKSIQAQLLAFNATKAQLPQLTELILDMVAAGKSADEVTNAIGGGLNGRFRGLSSLLNVGFDTAKSDAENFAEAIGIIQERFGGLARQLANTPTGQLKQLQNNFSDLKEEMGRALLQAANPWIVSLNESVRTVNSFASSSNSARTVVASAFSGMAVAIGTVTAALSAMKVQAALANAGLISAAGGRTAGAAGAGVIGSIGIVASVYELFKMGAAKAQQLDSESADRRMLEVRKNAIISLTAEMKRAGEVTEESAQQIYESISKAFNTQDMELWRKSLDAATKTLRPDLQLGGTAADVERKQRATLEQLQATKELDDLVLKLDADRSRGTRQQVAEATIAYNEQLRQIDELASKSKASAQDVADAKALAEEGFQAKLNDIYTPGTIALLEDRITIAAKRSSEERSTQIQKEFDLRIALYDKLLNKDGQLRSGSVPGGVNKDQYNELVRSARQRRAEEFASQSGAMNSERDSLTMGEGAQYEQQMQRRIAAVRAYYDGVIQMAREANQETARLEEQKTEHIEALTKRQTLASKQLYDGVNQGIDQAIQGTASGMTAAFDAMIDGTKSASQAWEDFGRSFLKMIRDIILQLLITIALKAALRAFGVPAADGGTFGSIDHAETEPSPAAKGMVKMRAAGGIDGVDEVSSPTFLPKFNVLAGEAGREMLTVLARPSFFDRDGMRGIVGLAKGWRLMVLPAEQVEQRLTRAASGYVSGGTSQFVGSANIGRGSEQDYTHIKIELSPELEARIVSESVRRSKVEVIRDVGRDTPMRKAVSSVSR